MAATRYAILLRAINVGGRNRLPMADLREILAAAGLSDVSTYLQSGNAIASSDEPPAALGPRVAAAIEERFDHRPELFFRTAAELLALARAPVYPDGDPKQVAVMFFHTPPATPPDASAFAPDVCQLDGPHLHVHCPSGFGRSKLTTAWVERQTGLQCTARNWRTISELASRLGGDA